MKPLVFLETLTLRSLLLCAGAFSGAMLAGALVAQYGFGLYPCHLCVLQRYPYVAVIVLVAAVYWLPPKWQWRALLLCGALFLLDAGIAFYHTGVELEWFPGPDACASNSSGEQTLEEMRRSIMEAPLVSCSQAMAYIFGLSLAAWNMIFATAATVLTYVVAARKHSAR